MHLGAAARGEATVGPSYYSGILSTSPGRTEKGRNRMASLSSPPSPNVWIMFLSGHCQWLSDQKCQHKAGSNKKRYQRQKRKKGLVWFVDWNHDDIRYGMTMHRHRWGGERINNPLVLVKDEAINRQFHRKSRRQT